MLSGRGDGESEGEDEGEELSCHNIHGENERYGMERATLSRKEIRKNIWKPI
jgi:hypothetical protein